MSSLIRRRGDCRAQEEGWERSVKQPDSTKKKAGSAA